MPQRIKLSSDARRDSELKRFVKTNFLIVNPKEELVYDLRKVLRDCIVEVWNAESCCSRKVSGGSSRRLGKI